jgi:hypothetical protein
MPRDPRLDRAGVSGYNKPKRTPSHPTKSHVVVAKSGDEVKTIRFGQQGVKGAGSSPKTASEKARRASKAMQEAGIPGIRYLDAGSRGAGDGSRNYVVFDENIINIVRKYGIAAAAIMLGMSQADLAQAMERQRQPSLLGGR